MSDSSHSEADRRIILHVFSCIHSALKDIYVQTNETDVMVILLAYMPDFLEIDSNVQVSVMSGVGFNTSFISVNLIGAYIQLKRCKESLLLHFLSGCDYTSSCFHVGKVTFWDVWLKFWYQILKYRRNSEIRLLPHTRDALIQHIHKVAYGSGYIWGTLHIPARME